MKYAKNAKHIFGAKIIRLQGNAYSHTLGGVKMIHMRD